MNILKYKYKAHKLVNRLFYIAVFLVGFCTGFLTNKIDFNKVIGQFLMIEDVKAYTFYENENIKVDEDYIYKGFEKHIAFFDMSTSKNVVCNFISDKVTLEPSYFYCLAFDDNSKNAINLNSSSDSRYVFRIPPPSYYVYWTYDTELKDFSVTDFSTKSNNYDFYVLFIASHVQIKTNFNFNSASDEHNEMFNQLNFDKYTLGYNDINIKPTPENYNNEEYIYNLFNELMYKSGYNSKFDAFSDVLVLHETGGSLNQYYYWFCNEDFTGSYSNFSNYGSCYRLLVDEKKKTGSLEYFEKTDNLEYGFSGASYPNQMATTSRNVSGISNYLDFSEFTFQLSYNENLFDNDPNFKEVCVNNYDKFSIISNDYTYFGDEENGFKAFAKTDFIWFKNGLSGLKTKLYYSGNDNNVLYLEDSSFYPMYDDFYWLNSKEVLDFVFSDDSPYASHLPNNGYLNKYSYFNYSVHPFIISFDNSENLRIFNIFWFENPTTLYLSSNDNIHGGGGSRLEDDTDLTYSKKYCFYVKKDFDVIIHDINEWGDINTNATILGGENVNFVTTENVLNSQNEGLFSVITTFSSRIRTTVLFINTNIQNLYLAMPLIVRMFILCVLTILFIKYLINMIVR